MLKRLKDAAMGVSQFYGAALEQPKRGFKLISATEATT